MVLLSHEKASIMAIICEIMAIYGEGGVPLKSAVLVGVGGAEKFKEAIGGF